MTRRLGSRAVRRAGRWLARRVQGTPEGGFMLLESLIAMTVIAVVMSAVGVEFLGTTMAAGQQRAKQGAVQVASSTVEQIRSLDAADLVTGRDASSVTTQFASAAAAVATVQPWLSPSIMDRAVDSTASLNSGISAALPTCGDAASVPACHQTVGTVPYTVNQYLGWCSIATGSTDCLATSTFTAATAATAARYLRAVVGVTWTGQQCAKTTTGTVTTTIPCSYVTSTLVSTTADRTFRINSAPYAAPVIQAPGHQTFVVGEHMSLQMAVKNNTGVPPFTWAMSDESSLPNGLSMSPTGLISGTVEGPLGDSSSTVQVTDAFVRTSPEVAVRWTVKRTAVNDAPVNSVPIAQQTPRNTDRVFSATNNNLISISDVDAGGAAVQVQLTATNGTLTLPVLSGLTFLVGDGTSDVTMTFTGTIATINLRLDGATFIPTHNTGSAGALQIVTSDLGGTGTGGTLTDTDTVTINVNAFGIFTAQQDIGVPPGTAGTSSYAAGTYTVAGSGSNIWDAADHFQYLSRPITGDARLTARVVSATQTPTASAGAKAGVMFRKTMVPGSIHATMDIMHTDGAEFQWRSALNGNAAAPGNTPGIAAPHWERITRVGDVVTGEWSPDGTAWTQQGSAQTITMGSSINVGLAVSAVDNTKFNTVTYDNVALSTPPTAVAESYSTNEDTSLNVAARGVLANDTDPENNTLTAVLVSGTTGLTLNPNGSFAYVPPANFSGPASFTYKANDGVFDSNTVTVNLTVNPANEVPSFTKGANQHAARNAGAQSVAGWATAVSQGTGESGQLVDFAVTNTNNDLFSVQPAVSADGTLTYTPSDTAAGVATVSVRLHDNFGTANGGTDTSPVKSFTITITADTTGPMDTPGLLGYWRLGEATASSDSFTGTARSQLAAHTGETGAAWTLWQAPTPRAVLTDAGRLRRDVTGGVGYYASGVPASADYQVEADVHVKTVPATATDDIGINGRIDLSDSNSIGTNYLLRYHIDGVDAQWQLRKNIVGVGTILATYNQTLTPGSTYHIGLKMTGSTISMLIDGVVRGTATDTSISAAGRAGVRLGASGSNATQSDTQGFHLDNFTVTPPIDDSKGGNVGDYVNAPTLGGAGAFADDPDTAAQFDGVNDYGSVTRAIQDDFSVECWFKSTAGLGTGNTQWWQGQGLVVADVSAGSSNDFGISLGADGRVAAGVGTVGSDISIVSGNGFDDGTWHHAVFTRKRSTGMMHLYVDKIEVGTGTTAATTSLTGANKITFGRAQALNHYFRGSLDDIAVYTSVLTPAQVAAHYELAQ